MNRTPEMTLTPDDAFIIHVRKAIVDILTGEPKLDVVRLTDDGYAAAEKSGMDAAFIRVRSHALDPSILSGHFVVAIRQDAKSKSCALVVGGVDMRRLDPGAPRGAWEAAARGWWVPVSLVARKNGVAS